MDMGVPSSLAACGCVGAVGTDVAHHSSADSSPRCLCSYGTVNALGLVAPSSSYGMAGIGTAATLT